MKDTNNLNNDKFIERDDVINEQEQTDSSDKAFIDYTEVDKRKMPIPDQNINVDEQENSSTDTKTVKKPNQN